MHYHATTHGDDVDGDVDVGWQCRWRRIRRCLVASLINMWKMTWMMTLIETVMVPSLVTSMELLGGNIWLATFQDVEDNVDYDMDYDVDCDVGYLNGIVYVDGDVRWRYGMATSAFDI